MPRVVAKPLSLTVRPLQAANLCFEVGGILGESFTELGQRVLAFDFKALYVSFRDADTVAGQPGRLELDSDSIDALTKPSLKPPPPLPPALGALRAEIVRAALTKRLSRVRTPSSPSTVV